LGRDEQAYSAFYKATWSHAWQSAAYLSLAELDAERGDWNSSIEHLESSLRTNTDNLNARNLAVVVSRKLGRVTEADRLLKETLALDPLDSWARYLAAGSLPHDNQTLFDLALDYARAGFHLEAVALLERMDRNASDGSVPILWYALGHLYLQIGSPSDALRAYSEASAAPPDYCFPHRLEEFVFLQAALSSNPEDARAAYYLGNLLYDRRRHREAIALWEQAAHRDPSFSTVWRNLGIGYFNILGDAQSARAAFDQAIRTNPADSRILYERDQLWKRLGESPERRLAELERHSDLVRLRDDLSVELANLLNQTRQHEKALSLLASRQFQPWEGGEGGPLGQHVRAHLALCRKALASGQFDRARALFESAMTSPRNLGEAPHLLANRSDIHYWLGCAYAGLGDRGSAQRNWLAAANFKGDFQEMSVRAFSEMTFYSAQSLKRLGQKTKANALFRKLLAYAGELQKEKAQIDYFATSLPAMLLFDDNLQVRQQTTALFLQAQALLGLGQKGQKAKARTLLRKVLRRDPNHAMAADFLSDLS
jgi:tetratricopeptide (TPR) repeat protein